MWGTQMIKYRCTGCGDLENPCELTMGETYQFKSEELRCVLADQDEPIDHGFKNEPNWTEVEE